MVDEKTEKLVDKMVWEDGDIRFLPESVKKAAPIDFLKKVSKVKTE